MMQVHLLKSTFAAKWAVIETTKLKFLSRLCFWLRSRVLQLALARHGRVISSLPSENLKLKESHRG